jgi:hypothetical protein
MKGHLRRKTCKRGGDRLRSRVCILCTDLNSLFVFNCLYFDTKEIFML